jgi:diguanylate cyclase (GGDEF)-like protein/PAS domain S-box-containing protein
VSAPKVAGGALDADQAPVALLEADEEGHITAANAALCDACGVAEAELRGRPWSQLLAAGSRLFVHTHCIPILLTRGHVAEVAVDLLDAAGERVPMLLYARRDPADGHLRVAFSGAAERRAQQHELRRARTRERARLGLQALTAELGEQALLGVAPDELHVMAADRLRTLLAAGRVTVVGADGRVGATAGALDVPPATAPGPFAEEACVVQDGPDLVALHVPVGPLPAPHAVLVAHRAGEEGFNAFEIAALQSVASVLWTAEVRFRDAREAEHRALHDPLTGLPNRQLLRDRLEQALALARRSGVAPAVLFLDLDDFKLVNDTQGHQAGDVLLRVVAERLSGALREVDTVARLGGDEFVVLCPEAGTAADAEHLALRVQEVLQRPVRLGGTVHRPRASVGVVMPSCGGDADSVLADADTAMYQAKAAGRGRHVVFDASMRARAHHRARIERELHEAITGEQLHCHLQPIVELADGRPVGLEALFRWEHPTRGLLLPAGFLTVAQQCGLMDALGAEVLGLACAAMADLRARVPAAAGLHLTVNTSVSQLASPGFVDLVGWTLHRHGLDGRDLRLEVTESLLIEHEDVAREALAGLRRLGVTIDIDDFGTGFSSLSRLHALPIDGLKIDRSFVASLGHDGQGDATIIAAILQLAVALGLDVVCEGVETDGQRRRLIDLGGRNGQGFLFARPLPARELDRWLAG